MHSCYVYTKTQCLYQSGEHDDDDDEKKKLSLRTEKKTNVKNICGGAEMTAPKKTTCTHKKTRMEK